jgi:hypothetical protein
MDALRFILGNVWHLAGAAILLLCLRPVRISVSIKGEGDDA